MKSILNILWRDWCWSWSSKTSATWYEEPNDWKRPWCWEILKIGAEVVIGTSTVRIPTNEIIKDLLPAVQGTLKSLLQHHSSKASILRRSAFFTVQLSHPYMTTGKTIALTRQTFVGKVIILNYSRLFKKALNGINKDTDKLMTMESRIWVFNESNDYSCFLINEAL